jgi:hypothetical protein
MTYAELTQKLQEVERATGLYLSDECVDLENVGRGATDSDLDWAARAAAADRAADAGRDINDLLGERVW